MVWGFYDSPIAKVIRRRVLGYNSHPKDRRSQGLTSRHLVYKESCSGLYNTRSACECISNGMVIVNWCEFSCNIHETLIRQILSHMTLYIC